MLQNFCSKDTTQEKDTTIQKEPSNFLLQTLFLRGGNPLAALWPVEVVLYIRDWTVVVAMLVQEVCAKQVLLGNLSFWT